jgi:hypothetical protein
MGHIIRQIRARRLRWAVHVASIGKERNVHRFLWESLKERDHSEDQDRDENGSWGDWLGVCRVDKRGSG